MVIKSRRVLVVDDDSNARALCSINLLLEGLEVLEAEDGRRGLARARLESPDLVVTDVAMPGLNGFELAEALRRDDNTAQIPLIFISGEHNPDNEALADLIHCLSTRNNCFCPLRREALNY